MAPSKRSRGNLDSDISASTNMTASERLSELVSDEDRQYMDELSDTELMEKYSQTMLRTMILVAELICRVQSSSNQMKEMEEQYLQVTRELIETRIANKEMRIQLEEKKASHADEMERACKAAREEAITEVLEADYKRWLEAFLQSPEYREMLVSRAREYYYLGFRACRKQFEEAGILPPGADTSFLDEDEGLEELLAQIGNKSNNHETD